MSERAGDSGTTTTQQARKGRRRWSATGGLLTIALLGAACADYQVSAQSSDPADGAAIAETTTSGDGPSGDGTSGDGTSGESTAEDSMTSAVLGATVAGDTIVGPDGRSLYGFVNDIQATSTCYGTCADAWPPVIVSPDWVVGPGLDAGIFATTVRDDGQLQLVAGKWPLYYYAGDGAPGDVNGHGSGEVWYLVAPTGTLIDENEPGTQDADQPQPDATPDGGTQPVAEGY
jgi:predicted lipoprotein with Yx(FWY)xxD motif